MTAQEAYILAKAYTNKSIEGAGSLKGAACQIKSIEAITGGHRITFEWEDNDGEVSTDTMDVMDGEDGSDGVGISSIAYKETDAHGNYVYTVTLSDTNTYDIICPKGAQGETGETGATGNGIASIEKTGTAGLVDTYTITYTNGQTTTFTVTNGESITVDSAMSGSSTNPVQNKVITEALALKQNATDNSLETEAKTIVGAINEHEGDIGTLKSGLTTLDNEVNGDATTYPYADVITIEDAVPSNLADCSVKIEPVQDLHGQSAPYVGGAGKQKLPLVLADIKTANTQGTWNGNTYTLNGASFTFNTDNGGNITSITVPTGTTTGATGVVIGGSPSDYLVENTGYAINGCPAGGSAESSYYMCFASAWTTGRSNIDEGQGSTIASFNPSDYEGKTFRIAIRSGYTIPTGGLTFYPMIRLSTETDATFAPYTNICPISGHTEASVQRDSKNLVDLADVTGTSGTVYGATKLLPAGTYYGYFFGEYQAWNHFYQYSLDGVNYTNFPTTDDGYAVADVSSGAYYHEKNKMTIHQPAYIRLGIQKNSSVGDNSVDALLTVDSTYYNVINDYTKTGIYYSKMYEPYAGKTYTIALGDTIYGGTVDFDSGVMTVTHAYFVISATSDFAKNVDVFPTVEFVSSGAPTGVQNSDVISNKYTKIASSSLDPGAYITGTGRVRINTSVEYESLQAAFDGELDGATFVYPLATPTTIQLTPQQIQLLKGQNTLTASTGQISVTVNGVSGAIGSVQEQVNATDEALAELAEKLPTAPTTDGAYVLTVTVADGTPTYSWESAT